MLEVRKLSKALGEFSLRGATFDVAAGEYFVLLGPSGVGKTVLLETLAGLLRPDTGAIRLQGRDVTHTPIQRRGFGLVYQDRALFPHMSVRGNIAYGMHCRRRHRAAISQRVDELAREVGCAELLARRPESLSGGEAQRVALARMLAADPACCLLDEPIASLDVQARAAMRALLRRLNRAGRTMLHVTHDFEEAISLASRIAVMENGRIVQTGTASEMLTNPKSPFVARFVGIRNFLEGELQPSGGDGAKRFVSDGCRFHVVTNAAAGPGFLTIRSEEIVLSNERTSTSARNQFQGRIYDIVPTRRGVEIGVDVGVRLTAAITEGSLDTLGLAVGGEVWMSFKATAARFIER